MLAICEIVASFFYQMHSCLGFHWTETESAISSHFWVLAGYSAYRAAYRGLFLGYTATDKNIRFGP